jgi:hypothetical protein
MDVTNNPRKSTSNDTVSFFNASRADMQGVSIYFYSRVDVQGVSLSAACSEGVHGEYLSTVSSLDVKRVYPSPPSYNFLTQQCRKQSGTGIRGNTVRYWNKGKQSGSGIGGNSPVLEYVDPVRCRYALVPDWDAR